MTTWIEWTDEEYTNLGLQSDRIDEWLSEHPDYYERFKYWLHQWPDEKEFHVWQEVEVWAYQKLYEERLIRSRFGECKHIPDGRMTDGIAMWQHPLKCVHCDRLLKENSSHNKRSGWTYVWWEAIE